MLENLPDAIGHALHDRRAGLDHLAMNRVGLRAGQGAIDVRSIAFADHAPIPAKYTADGPGISPPMQWSGVPSNATSIIVMVEDADAPTPQPLVHAIAVDLEAGDGALAEGALDDAHDGAAGPDARIGRNSFLRKSWLPPDPPPGHGVHRYAFQVFALRDGPRFDRAPGRDAVLDALSERAVASGFLIGTYERPDGSQKVRGGANEPVALANDAVDLPPAV